MSSPNSRDPDLSGLLQTWQVEAPDDPQLPHKVWQRIGTDVDTPPRRSWLENFARLLTQPAFAVAAIAIFAAVGALTAEVTRSSQHEARLARLAAEYAHAIDPVLMSDHSRANPHR